MGCEGYAFFATGILKSDSAATGLDIAVNSGDQDGPLFKPANRQIYRYNLTSGQVRCSSIVPFGFFPKGCRLFCCFQILGYCSPAHRYQPRLNLCRSNATQRHRCSPRTSISQGSPLSSTMMSIPKSYKHTNVNFASIWNVVFVVTYVPRSTATQQRHFPSLSVEFVPELMRPL